MYEVAHYYTLPAEFHPAIAASLLGTVAPLQRSIKISASADLESENHSKGYRSVPAGRSSRYARISTLPLGSGKVCSARTRSQIAR